ncbi:MAG: Glu/Leu/Phe/Val dehydrogenase [Rhodocyclaceae bacterium]|nr:Glu/Leu/Phe/Val dehydrogenase [Rhodocyclaceae bacterium]
MSVFSEADYDNHEQVVFCSDAGSGLRAVIAIHNCRRGPALGGCRMWPYASEQDAVRDALRLSRGMTYKSAMARLPLGGGKAVVIGDPHRDKSRALLEALALAVDRLGGRYIVAEDSGTTVADMQLMRHFTPHVAGVEERVTANGVHSGDPSPATAYGVFVGIRAAVRVRLGQDSLTGLRVALQGVGHVGLALARRLEAAGARLWITDVRREALSRAARELAATVVEPQEIFGLDVDLFAPCALGAVIDDQCLPRLKAAIVAGAANNQLAEARHDAELFRRGILYAPDYVINAGGIIDIHYERSGYDHAAVTRHIDGIDDSLTEIFQRSRQQRRPTGEIADRMAEELF